MLNLLKTVQLIKRAEGYSREQIKAVQEQRLRELLKHVYENSLFYREYYREHGITAGDLHTIGIKDLPPVDKDIMMEHYDDLVCDPVLKKRELNQFISDPANRAKKFRNRYKVIHTSGTSGRIGIFVYGPSDWDVVKALAAVRGAKTGINPVRKIKLSYFAATEGHYAGISLLQDAPGWFFKFQELSVGAPLQSIDQKINQFKPDILSGYASAIDLLAREQISGSIDIAPEKILCSGDTLTKQMRHTIKRAFGVDPVNVYAMSEAMIAGAGCEDFNRLHLFDDWFICEITDDNLQQVKAGEPGKLILTNLFNRTQPIIRYKMDDQIVASDKPCKCGWPFQVIEDIFGHDEDYLWFYKPDGRKEYIHPAVIIEFFAPGLEKFQIIQVKKNRLLMKAVICGERNQVIFEIKNRMREILSQKGLEKYVSFDVEVVEELKNDPKTGKFILIVPYK